MAISNYLTYSCRVCLKSKRILRYEMQNRIGLPDVCPDCEKIVGSEENAQRSFEFGEDKKEDV